MSIRTRRNPASRTSTPDARRTASRADGAVAGHSRVAAARRLRGPRRRRGLAVDPAPTGDAPARGVLRGNPGLGVPPEARRKYQKDRGGDHSGGGDGDANGDASLGRGVWWPGRVWKLRNARSAAALWRNRGAPVPAQGVGQMLRRRELRVVRAERAREVPRRRYPRDARAAELFASAARGCARRDWSATGGIRVYAQNVRKALREAEEAEIMDWDTPPWTDSDDAYSDDDDDRDQTRSSSSFGRGRRGPREREAATDDADHHDGTPKDGLTPDWIIDAGCRMFGLNVPTVQEPIIKGLLDPCTNDKRDPNIPAEKTYDKRQDGLKQENPWKGYHVILNPSYESQVQWRFINRAINEVEWGFCPGILLVCRNSTDTSYFQRLLPFPRIFLRRDAVRFKDYTHTPIGFGIAVFCLVSPIVTPEEKMATYSRFYNEFRHAGEFNIPFDGEFLSDVRFKELTDRLHVEAALKYRDSWVACDECDRWREVPPTQSSRRLVLKTRGGAGTRIRSSGATLPSPVESTRRSPWRQKDKLRPCWRRKEGPTSSAMMAPTRRTRRKTAWCWHCRAPRLRKRLRRRLLKNTSPMRRR